MSWWTGELVVTQGGRRNAELFVAHLEDLRRRFRFCRRIHVICDGSTEFAEVNARFHTSAGGRLVRQYLAEHGDRIVQHYLPAYSPQATRLKKKGENLLRGYRRRAGKIAFSRAYGGGRCCRSRGGDVQLGEPSC